jgi:hypothetical protein
MIFLNNSEDLLLFALTFTLIFILTSTEVFNLKKITINNKSKNTLSALMLLSSFTVSILFYLFIFSKELNSSSNFKIFEDWRLYFTLITEILGFWLLRKNYEVNKSSITAINFALFLSLVIVPIYSFFGDSFFGFENTNRINYKSKEEFLIFILIVLFLSFMFFIDKFKGQINNYKILFILPIIMSNNLYFTTKLMQTYNSFFTYSVIAFFMMSFFIILAIKNKELKNIKNIDKKTALLIMGATSIAIPMNNIAVTLLAAEFFTLIKRICQVLSGLLFDKIYGNKNSFNKKDIVVVFLLTFSGFTLYLCRA